MTYELLEPLRVEAGERIEVEPTHNPNQVLVYVRDSKGGIRGSSMAERK
jgi:hypothetical protein